MKHLRYGLGGLLALCIVLRIGAWLVGPVLPLVAVLFGVIMILSFILRGGRGLS